MKRALLILAAVGMLGCAPYGSERWKDNWEKRHREVCDDLARGFCCEPISVPIRRWGGPAEQKKFGDVWFVQFGWHPGSVWEFRVDEADRIISVSYLELLHDRRVRGRIDCDCSREDREGM